MKYLLVIIYQRPSFRGRSLRVVSRYKSVQTPNFISAQTSKISRNSCFHQIDSFGGLRGCWPRLALIAGKQLQLFLSYRWLHRSCSSSVPMQTPKKLWSTAEPCSQRIKEWLFTCEWLWSQDWEKGHSFIPFFNFDKSRKMSFRACARLINERRSTRPNISQI